MSQAIVLLDPSSARNATGSIILYDVGNNASSQTIYNLQIHMNFITLLMQVKYITYYDLFCTYTYYV